MSTESMYDPGDALRAGERMLARAWRLIALRGVVAIGFAIVLLIWPDIGLAAMVGAVGVFAIVSGLVSAAGAFALPGAVKRHRFWLAAHALLGVLAGTAVLVWPGISAVALLTVIALWAIAVGVIELTAAFTLPLSGPRTLLVAVGGIALAAIGVLMFVAPGNGAVALLGLVAAFALARGASDVTLAVQLRRVSRELDRPWGSLTGATTAARA